MRATAPMVDLGAYILKDLNTGKVKPEESFTDAYVEEVYRQKNIRTATKRLRVILDDEKEYLHKVMETQCQHLTKTNVMIC